MLAFFKSVAIGALVSAVPALLFTIPLAVGDLYTASAGDRDVWSDLAIVAFPLLLSAPAVFAASICIGLPVTVILARMEKESEAAHILAGGMAGLAIPIIGVMFLGGSGGLFSFCGALGGAFTARTWWKSARAPRVGSWA